MLSYCLKCKKKNTKNPINPRFPKTSNGKTMLLSKCATFKIYHETRSNRIIK